MKKGLILLSIMLLVDFCGFAQNSNWKLDATSNQQIPVGLCSWNDLQNAEFASSMQTFYQHYEPNWMYLSDLNKIMHERFPEYQLHCYVYFGAWNHDCLEVVPDFVRYTELLAEQYHQIVKYDLVAVDRTLKTGNAALDNRNLTSVPTIFITFEPVNGGQAIEVGQVNGLPRESLEADVYFQLAHYYKMHQ